MVKLKYIGVTPGICKCSGFKQSVEPELTYDVPDNVVKKLLDSGLWENIKKENKKNKEE